MPESVRRALIARFRHVCRLRVYGADNMPTDPLSPQSTILEWEPVSGFTLRARRADGRTLAVSVALAGGRWTVIAIESPAGAGLAAIMKEHAHALIGRWRNVRTALRRAERWAVTWGAKSTTIEACGCGHIAAPSVPAWLEHFARDLEARADRLGNAQAGKADALREVASELRHLKSRSTARVRIAETSEETGKVHP